MRRSDKNRANPVTAPVRAARLRTRAIAAFAIGLLSALAIHRPVSAEDAPPNQWQFFVSPYLWVAGVSGTATTPIPSAPPKNIEASFGDVLENLSAIPLMGAFEMRNGQFGVLADFMFLSVKADVTTRTPLFNNGSTQLRQINGTVLGMVRVAGEPGRSLDLGLGFRPWSINTKFTFNSGVLPGFSKSVSAGWFDPLLAARAHFDFTDRIGVTGYADIGGFGVGSELTWQLMGTLDYRWNNWVVMRLGYRHLQIDYRTTPLRLNMGLSGPILAVTMQF